ncbi:uncharacterized protein [Asterias amurensis]|uniref:uncharacterized protein n=1 Tax=Asterias amurensis TaxID=7602 RepID=UPI003AB258BF
MDEVRGVTVLDNIRKAQLECSICYSQYKNPKTLTCEHNFCQHCLEEMMEAHPTKSISCPVCGTETSSPEAGIDDLTTSFSLINLMETIAEQERLVEHHGLSGQTVLENISKAQLECPICYSQYINPKTLTCKHNFCQNCLEEMRIASALEENIICPICRKETNLNEEGIDDLSQSLFLFNLMETIVEQQQLVSRLQTKINCQDCDEEDEAVSYCLDCQEFLCEVCDNAHQRSKRTKSHEKASIDHLRSGKASFKKNYQLLTNVPKCGTHPNQNKIFYCQRCFIMICASCTQDHRNPDHKVVGLSQAIESSNDNINDRVKDVEKCLQKFSNKRELLDMLSTEHQERIKQKHKIITDDADRKVAELRKEEQKLKDKVTRFCYEKGKEFKKIMASNCINEKKIKQQLEKVNNDKKEVQEIDLLKMQQSLMRDLQDALDVGYPTGCVCLNFKDFKESSDFTDEEIYLMFGQKRNMTDSEVSDRMKVGTCVVRGKKWHWGAQDGDPPGEGVIRRNNWGVLVEWDEGFAGYLDRYSPKDLDLAWP